MIYSQHGEDGALKRLLEVLGIRKGWCCELGAWDGIYFSNTYYLIEQGWNGVYIEGDAEKFSELEFTQKKFPDRIIALNETIYFNEYGGELLDDVLSLTPIPLDFDILSIDVDGPDYQIWKFLERYNPKIVIIEQSGIDGWHIHNPLAELGDPDVTTSFEPLKALGEEKGYTLVALMGNMIFVANEYIR
jgi:hypothetical protein